MYPKHKILKLIEQYAPSFKTALGIRNKVEFHVFSRETKKYKELSVSKGYEMGLSFIAKNGDAEIIIFYDQHSSERDVIGTILHELLHVRFFRLTGLVTINSDKAYYQEEKLVRSLEELFIKTLYGELR